MHPPELPPLTKLERLVFDHGYHVDQGSFDEHCERYREHLRREIDRRLREKGEAWEKLDRVIERRENGR